MKKEIAAIVILTVLIVLSLLNIHYLDSLTEELIGYIDEATAYADLGEFDRAVEYAEIAAERWREVHFYTHITIRHSEINTATDTFYDFLGDLYAEDAGAARGSALKLKAQLESIAEMEHVSLGSVL